MKKNGFEAVVFDLDGVITQTAVVHSTAWKKMFDGYLREREQKFNEPFREFRHQEDYLPYVDGKPRYKGVQSFFESRNIKLPYGDPTDTPDMETICGLGNKKDKLFNEIIQTDGVQVYESSVKMIHELLKKGIKVGCATSSKNSLTVLKSAGVLDLFEVRIDGLVSAEMKLKGKPEPDIFTVACDKLGVTYDKAVVVEDAVSGVQAGSKGNFGLTLGIAREHNNLELKIQGADIVVNDLSEISIDDINEWFNKGLEEDKSSLNYYEYSQSKERSREALLTIGNGYFGTRGALEETDASTVNYPGTYIAGVYNKLDSQVADKTVTNEDLVNCPNWLPCNFKIDEGEWLDINNAEIISHHRKLDFKNGLLYRKTIIKDKSDRQSCIESWRFAGMHNPHYAGIKYIITPLNYSGKITFRTGLNGNIINEGVERYRQLNSKHLEAVEQGALNNLSFLLVRTNQSGIKIGEASEIKPVLNNKQVNTELNHEINTGSVYSSFEMEMKQNEQGGFEKSVSIFTSIDMDVKDPLNTAKKKVKNKSFNKELKQSENKWKEIWNEIDIVIEGDRYAQKLLRMHLYHMMVSASMHNENIDAGITARGLHGEAYRGHIFWDELFIMPFYDMHFKETAKSLLMYRYRRLEKARENAIQHGHKGAMYPWQAGSEGGEETQILHLNPVSGEWGDDYSSLQRHVSLAVAYNIWQYYSITEDIDFLKQYGAEMFFDICRFWASKAELNPQTGKYSIRKVMGPDEFHEKYADTEEGGLKDNAYTNIMAAWAFRTADKIATELGVGSRENDLLTPNYQLPTEEEIVSWQEIADNINIIISDNDIISQYDGYFDLKELDWEFYKSKYGNIHRMDRLLKAEGKSPDEFKVAKQADTLMTFYNLDVDEVNEILQKAKYKINKDSLKNNYDYYYNRTSHGSTLSRVVHAYLANLIGDRKLCWKLYMDALTSDYVDVQGGTTGEGIHTGVMASTIMLTLYCFAGLKLNKESLSVNPNLPEHWRSMKFGLHFKKHKYEFKIEM